MSKEEPIPQQAIAIEKTTATNTKSIFQFFIRKWWFFLIVGAAAGLAGFFYAKSQKPTYKSRLTFALDDGGSGGKVGGFASLASQFGLSIGGGKDIFDGENIIEIIKSRRIVEKVLLSVDTFNHKPYRLIEYLLEINGKFKQGEKQSTCIHFPANQLKPSFTYQQDSLLKKEYLTMVKEAIQANKPDKKLNIFEVNVTSNDEKFSKVFTDRLVQETNEFYTEIRSKKARETLAVLEQRVASMKGNLNSSISSRASVQDANINPAFASAQVPALKHQANIQVYSGAYAEMFKNLELARFQYLNELPLMQIIDEANYPMEKIKMGKLKTAVIFSFFACLLLALILWVKRIFFSASHQEDKE